MVSVVFFGFYSSVKFHYVLSYKLVLLVSNSKHIRINQRNMDVNIMRRGLCYLISRQQKRRWRKSGVKRNKLLVGFIYLFALRLFNVLVTTPTSSIALPSRSFLTPIQKSTSSTASVSTPRKSLLICLLNLT